MNIKSFLLENTGIRQTIFKNTFWLAIAEIVSGFLRLALLIYVARILGVTEYGKFTFAFSFVSVIAIFSDLGIIDIITREFSRNKEREKDFSAILALEVILSALTLIVMILGSFFITSDPVIQKIIWILSVFILITSFSGAFYSFLRSRQRMEYEAGVKIIQAITMVVVVFFAIYYTPSVISLSYGYLFSNVITLVLLLLFFSIFIQPLTLRFDKNIFKLLKISWPLSLGNMTVWFYISVSSIMLGYFNLITENGWYSAASRVAFIALLPATLIIASFYPVLSKFFLVSKEKIQKSWDYMMQSMVFLAVPVVMGGIALAPKIIGFFYTPEFTPSIFVFKFLIFAVGINFINYPYSLLLVVADQQKKNFFLIMIGIIASIILNFILIPLYDLNGAIVATVISSLLVLFLSIVVSKYFTPIAIFSEKILKGLILAIFSGLVMLFVIYQPMVYGFNLIVLIAIGMCSYFLAFVVFYKVYMAYQWKRISK